MSWGDPFIDLDDYGTNERSARLIEKGFVPGALVDTGIARSEMIALWYAASWTSGAMHIRSGLATIIAVDCASDPSTDWLYILISGTGSLGWIPTGMTSVQQ